MRVSEKDLTYLEPDGKRITPEVVEPSVGCDRLLYALVCEKYEKETLENGEEREVLKLIYELAPYKCAILPLGNKLNDKAREVFNKIIDRGISASFDTSGSIGKRYRRADAIGTFYCITIDFDTENDNCVTIRDRDTMKQERVKIDDLFNYLK
jgi:glycyl-tRNA synthetase